MWHDRWSSRKGKDKKFLYNELTVHRVMYTGNCSAIVLDAVGIYRAVTRKLYIADSQKSLRSHCIASGLLEVPLLYSA